MDTVVGDGRTWAIIDDVTFKTTRLWYRSLRLDGEFVTDVPGEFVFFWGKITTAQRMPPARHIDAGVPELPDGSAGSIGRPRPPISFGRFWIYGGKTCLTVVEHNSTRYSFVPDAFFSKSVGSIRVYGRCCQQRPTETVLRIAPCQ